MPPLTVMVKPASGLCNLRCRYCFYTDVSSRCKMKFNGIMTHQTLDNLIRRSFAYAEDSVSLIFQGGEPLLAGLEFFRNVVTLEKKHNTRKLQVSNAIQTNALLINDDFAQFLYDNQFLVGVSLDGSRETHDAFRVDPAGKGSWERVMNGIQHLQKHKVEFNILCVVSQLVAKHPQETFDALKNFKYLQFISCLDGFDGAPDTFSLTPELYASFLNVIFDDYERVYRSGKPISIRLFDNYLQILLGLPPENCGMSGCCGQYMVVEADGGIYPCDFYVTDKWRIGNINQHSFYRIAQSETWKLFIQSSLYKDTKCNGCPYYFLCRGGCRRDREPFVNEHPGLNRFCESYKAFFTKNLTRMQALARHAAGLC